MAKNVCPRCREVILSLGPETDIKCSKCEISVEVGDDSGKMDDGLDIGSGETGDIVL